MPQPMPGALALSILALVLLQPASASAADDDADALSLASAPVESTKPSDNTRLFIEGALGGIQPHQQTGWQGQERLSIDFSSSYALAPGWRAVISDRLDSIHPAGLGSDATVNSLREAYVSWQQSGGATVVDLGRVNLRYGPAYGYNPTDFFRDNTLRAITTANPLSLRQDRLGTFLLRGQQLWGDNAVSLSYAPKLASRATGNGFSVDAGATNDRGRALLTLSSKLTDRVAAQFLVYKEDKLPAQVGASATALVTDAIVAYAEGSRGSEPDLLSRTLAASQPRQTRNRLASGLTFTPVPKISITAEYEYNGFALSRGDWDALRGSGSPLASGYLLEAVNRQEISARQAWLGFATVKDAGTRNLDLTALLRVNASDRSRLAWIEFRYHWSSCDLALQVQQQGGGQTTEYGLLPGYRSIQLLASYHLF